MRLSSELLVTAAAAVLLLAARWAAQGGRPPADSLDPDAVRFAPALGVNLAGAARTWSGGYARDVTVGAGEPASAGRTVTLRFRGWLPSGAAIDGDTAQLFTFTLGSGIAMPGVEEGVDGMRVGGRRQLVVPPGAQGPQGVVGVPPGDPIVLDVELVDVR
jgi:FKBP-type peptidyl-prolyl cis-trans isomerase